jgi:uncharacterized protein (TIGR03067 family)
MWRISMGRCCAVAGVFFLLTAASLNAADKPPSLPKAIQGDWVATGIEYCGQQPPADIVRKYKVTVKDDVITLAPLNHMDGKFNVKGEPLAVRCEHDPKADPNRIDLILRDGDVEHRMLGIYAVEGKQLKICWQHDGKARPTEFKTKAEPSQMMVVLVRSKH